MGEKVSEVEENTLRVLLSTLRKHDPDALKEIIFDVLLAGLKGEEVHVFLRVQDNEGKPTDDPIVESAVMAIRGAKNAAKFFSALEAAGLDEAEDTELP